MFFSRVAFIADVVSPSKYRMYKINDLSVIPPIMLINFRKIHLEFHFLVAIVMRPKGPIERISD